MFRAAATSRLVGSAITALLLCACANQPDASRTLYERMGGESGVSLLVNELILNIAADDRIRHHFRSVHVAGFRRQLETHFCEIAGGPCHYDGRSMREVHARLGVSAADFNALVEGLMQAMDASGIDHATQNAFLARLVPMQRDIVVTSRTAD